MKKTLSLLTLLLTFLITPIMAYSTNQQLANASDESTIVQLVDDQITNLATIEAVEAAAADPDNTYYEAATEMLARIEAARADGDELINTFLRGRHTVPLEPVPSFIEDLSIDLTIHNLFKRRMRLDMPESAKELKSAAMKTLRSIQRGDIKISDQPDIQSGQIATNKTARDKVFDDELLSRY